MKIVLEGFSGTISVADLCRKYDIKSARFYSWKKKLMNSSAEIFDDRGRKSTSGQLIIEEQRIEIEKLKGTIADVVSENLETKKKIGERLQRRGRI